MRVLARSFACAACGVGVARSLPMGGHGALAARLGAYGMCLIAVIQLSRMGEAALRALTIFCPFVGITPQNRESEDYRQKKSKHSRKQQEIRLTVRRIYFAPICITVKKGQNREKTQKKSKQNCFRGVLTFPASYNGVLSPSTP